MSADLTTEEFATRLAGRMAASGETGAGLAAHAGLDKKRVQRLRRGEHGPTLYEITRLARALACSRAWLAFGEGRP